MFCEKHFFFCPVKDAEQSPDVFSVPCSHLHLQEFIPFSCSLAREGFVLFLSIIFSWAPFFFLFGLNETKPSAGSHTACLGGNSILFLEQQLGRRLVNGSQADSEFWRATAVFTEATQHSPPGSLILWPHMAHNNFHSFFHEKEPGLLGEMADSRSGQGIYKVYILVSVLSYQV